MLASAQTVHAVKETMQCIEAVDGALTAAATFHSHFFFSAIAVRFCRNARKHPSRGMNS